MHGGISSNDGLENFHLFNGTDSYMWMMDQELVFAHTDGLIVRMMLIKISSV